MMIGGFFDAHHAGWGAHERALFAALLTETDVDIMAWGIGTQDVPERYQGPMMDAFQKLDFMVSIDIYINETTRHADVILPPCWNLSEDHIDLLFGALGVRNIARWSPAVVERGEDELADWEILLELTERLGGGPLGEPWVDRVLGWLRPLGVRWTPTGFLNLLLRIGPHGDRFLPWSNGLNMRKLKAAPHGIDLGPLKPGVEERLFHRDKRIHLASPLVLGAIDTLARGLDTAPAPNGLVLIGRRELRSNNSWMHNVPALVSGRERCVLGGRGGLPGAEAVESELPRGADLVREAEVVEPALLGRPPLAVPVEADAQRLPARGDAHLAAIELASGGGVDHHPVDG